MGAVDGAGLAVAELGAVGVLGAEVVG